MFNIIATYLCFNHEACQQRINQVAYLCMYSCEMLGYAPRACRSGRRSIALIASHTGAGSLGVLVKREPLS